MLTTLNAASMLPLSQPFNTAPWNYAGPESVASIPNPNIVDWILVELRQTAGSASTATPATIIGRQAGFILKGRFYCGHDGITMLRFDLVISQNLFAVVYHRNHLGIISANPLLSVGGTYTLDFSSGSGQAHGGSSAQKQIIPGVWALFSGDGDGNGTVNMNDKIFEWQIQAGTKGFKAEDYNMDGQVNNPDKDDRWLPNVNKSTYIPQ